MLIRFSLAIVGSNADLDNHVAPEHVQPQRRKKHWKLRQNRDQKIGQESFASIQMRTWAGVQQLLIMNSAMRAAAPLPLTSRQSAPGCLKFCLRQREPLPTFCHDSLEYTHSFSGHAMDWKFSFQAKSCITGWVAGTVCGARFYSYGVLHHPSNPPAFMAYMFERVCLVTQTC